MTAPADEVSLDIAAPPARLYELVSDVTSMGRWSPETRSARWIGGASGPQAGARFKGTNRWGMFRWTTTVEVEVAEPERAFTFVTIVTGRKRTRWSYRFAARDGVTTVTETRTVLSSALLHAVAERLFLWGHHDSFAENMRRTLERLKHAAESAV